MLRTKEHNEKIGAANKISVKRYYDNGGVPWNKKEKVTKKCEQCGKEFIIRPARIKTAKYCSKECLGIINGRRVSKENHWNWKGGKDSNERREFMLRSPYKKWRKAVFEKDNYTCQKCGIKSSKGQKAFLHAHHIKSYFDHEKLRLVLDNGITLCRKCHYKIHSTITAD